jgi:hypothetical protein
MEKTYNHICCMSANQPPEDHALRRVLSQWTLETPLPPRFQEQVWQRIAKAETRPEPPIRAALWRAIEAALPRPKFALAYLSVLLASGVLAGSWAAQAKTTRMDSALSLRYVQAIDPYRAGNSQP